MKWIPSYDLYVECSKGWMKVLENGSYQELDRLMYKWQIIEGVQTKTVTKYL